MIPKGAAAAADPSAVDLTALAELRQRAAREDPRALAEAAVQFEALFIGLMLKTARDASLGEGIFDGAQMQQYLELMDQQVALELARHGGFGFAKVLIEQLAPAAPPEPGNAPAVAPRAAPAAAPGEFPRGLPQSLLGLRAWPATSARSEGERATGRAAAGAETRSGASLPQTPNDFVARHLPEATAAAARLGVEPKLLLAQAALETGWGNSAPRHPDGSSANNLFGIKATGAWGGGRVSHWTIENVGGVAERKRAAFRAYPSTAESFADYADLIANSPRYAAALEHARDPEQYAREVTAAGYATDPSYVEKWLAIYRGAPLENALRGLKHGSLAPTK